MSVLGIDIGNAFCVVAAAVKGGVDVVLNEESKRETPTCVALGERQRFLGAAAASAGPGTTVVSQIKRLIGRPYDDDLKSELQTLFPNLKVSGDSQGYPLLHFKYRDEEVSLSPTQLLGMLLGGLKRSAERHFSTAVSDCCIAVPAHFNDVQRRAVLHAAEIAGLRPLRLLHESSAAVLEYGIYRRDFPVNRGERAHIAVIVDVGHSATQVAVAKFWAGGARILARAADPNLGGRDFDGALYDHFAARLVADDPDLDVTKSVRAAARLRASCEKVKKVLSANPEAMLHIECFMEDKDASVPITREDFERICDPLLARLRLPLQKALTEVGLKPEDKIDAVELIGSGSRVPAVVRVVAEVFEQEPRRTLNASECVGRGCALQAAMLSPAFQVKKFAIHENAPFGIYIAWKDINAKLPSGSAEEQHRYGLLSKGDRIPLEKVVVIDGKENTFSFDLVYAENPVTTKFSTYHVGPFVLSRNGFSQPKIAFKLDCNGIMSVDSVTVLLDKDDSSSSPQETREDDSRMDIDDEISESCAENPETLHEASNTSDSVRTSESDDHNYKEAEKKNRKTLGQHITENPLQKEKVLVQVQFSEHVYGSFSVENLEEAKKMEAHMASWDREVEETKNHKNALESYVYEMRNKLRGKYQEFVTEAERQLLVDKLKEVENWLYEEGEDVSLSIYIDKLYELKMHGDPIENRFRESLERGAAVERLRGCIAHFRSQCCRPQYDHIDRNEKLMIQADCRNIEYWLSEQMEAQNKRQKYEDAVLSIRYLHHITEELARSCGMILSKPAPPPPKSMADLVLSRLQKQFTPHRGNEEVPRPHDHARQQQPQVHRGSKEIPRTHDHLRQHQEPSGKIQQSSRGGGDNLQKPLEEEVEAETGRPPRDPGNQQPLQWENGEETMSVQHPPFTTPPTHQREGLPGAMCDEVNLHSESSRPVGEPLPMATHCKAKDYPVQMCQPVASSEETRDSLDMRSLGESIPPEERSWEQLQQLMARYKTPYQEAGRYDGKATNCQSYQGSSPSGEFVGQRLSGHSWPKENRGYTRAQSHTPCQHAQHPGRSSEPEERRWEQQQQLKAHNNPLHHEAGSYNGKPADYMNYQGYPPSRNFAGLVCVPPDSFYYPPGQAQPPPRRSSEPYDHSTGTERQAPPANYELSPVPMPHIPSNQIPQPPDGTQGVAYGRLTRQVENDERSYREQQRVEDGTGNSRTGYEDPGLSSQYGSQGYQQDPEASHRNPGQGHGSVAKKTKKKGVSLSPSIFEKTYNKCQNMIYQSKSSTDSDTRGGKHTPSRSISGSEANMPSRTETGKDETSRTGSSSHPGVNRKSSEPWR